MKKITVMLLVILAAMALSSAALAAGPLERMYDSAVELFFDTDSVTINGSAEFSLDGQRFKTVKTTYIQDGSDSYWDLALSSPRYNGTELENGFTIVANGQKLYVIEAFNPGVYKTGTNEAQSTIIRRTLKSDLIVDILRQLAAQADELPGAVTTVREGAEGLEIRLRLGEDIPEPFNNALTLAAQFAAERYFGINYDSIRERNVLPVSSYLTVSQGIMGATKRYSLKDADITFRRDSLGHLDEVSGSASVYLDTGKDGTREMEISFRMDVSSWDESVVSAFDPEKFGVKIADDAMDIEGLDLSLSPKEFLAKWEIDTNDLYAWYSGLIEKNGPFDSWPVDEQLRVSRILDDVNQNYELLDYFYVDGWADSTCVAYDVTQWRYGISLDALVSEEEAKAGARKLLQSRYGYGDESGSWEARISLYTGHWASVDFDSPWWVVRFYDGNEKKTEVWVSARDGSSPAHDSAVPVAKAKAAFLTSGDTIGGQPASEKLFTQEHVTAFYEDLTASWHVIVENGRDSFWEDVLDDETMESRGSGSSNG